MIDVIAFDADDTLWDNEGFYIQAKERFKRLLAENHTPEQVERRLDEIEVHNVEFYGYGLKSFMLSMIETSAQLRGGQIESGIIQEIISIGKQILMTEVQPFEYAEAVLTELSQSYRLMLITKGDTFEQERKIKQSDLSRYFYTIDIISEKSSESYRALLDKYRIDPGRFLMVGNSIRSDILPVIRIGGKAMYIPYEHTWSHEMIDEPLAQEGAYYKVANLGELVGLVKRLETRDTFGKDNP